jgi:uncharacterized membrane protein (DUF4010 family)
VRDFILIALAGGVCGLLSNAFLTAAALISVAGLLAVFHIRAAERTGITTELAAVATFCLGYLTAAPTLEWGAPVAIGTSIIVVALLEAKRSLHKLIRETITETEFNDTLWFLGIIFIIYPVLPAGDFGPYGFFSPRKVWLFVILISSISYVGYFLQRFLGKQKGLALTAVLGGIASTTAATASFARAYAAEQSGLRAYWSAAVIANTVHFPRVLAVLFLIAPSVAAETLAPLSAMTVGGALLAVLLAGRAEAAAAGHVPVGNPFRLAPALKLGAVLTIVLFATRVAAAHLGAGAMYWTSALAGSVDVDAVVLSAVALFSGGTLQVSAAAAAVYIALAANAVFKTGLAFYAGKPEFGWRILASFTVLLGAGLGAWALLRGR